MKTEENRPLLVVVTGPPAAGKTTVARGIAARLRLPLIEKDTIKEALFDTLGTGDVAWSQRLGKATLGVIWALLEQSLRAGAGAVVEANFVRGQAEPQFERLPSSQLVQVHCGAPLDVLLARYGSRKRHPGHVDSERIEALEEAVETGRHDPLDLPGETILLDTSGEIDLADLARRIRRAALWQAVGDAAGPVGETTPLAEKVRIAAWTIVDADASGMSADELYGAVLPVAFAAADEKRRRAQEAIDAS
jgi:predicted kinase